MINLRLKTRIIEIYGSQADFAQSQKVNESLVSRVVRERRSIPAEVQKRWADALDCKPEEIFKD